MNCLILGNVFEITGLDTPEETCAEFLRVYHDSP